MHTQPTDEQRARALADKHGLTMEQARQLIADHGHDESKLGTAVDNLISFLRAPS